MLIVQDRKVVIFFSIISVHALMMVFVCFFLLILSFSSLVSARILWSIFIKFQNCICYLFRMIVSHSCFQYQLTFFSGYL